MTFIQKGMVAVPAYEGTQANHAVYANPILFKEGFVFDDTPYDFIKTVEECDEIIKSHSYDELLSNYEDIILTRKFVSFFGYDKRSCRLVGREWKIKSARNNRHIGWSFGYCCRRYCGSGCDN